MNRTVFICFFLLIAISSQAQNPWCNYLMKIKPEFYYNDTIVVQFKQGSHMDPKIKLRRLDLDTQKLFKSDKDTLIEDGNTQTIKYFLSFYLSKDLYSTLVLYSAASINSAGYLYLYNFSPSGKLLTQIKLQGGWSDAGESYLSKSTFINDSTIKVIYGVGFEKSNQDYSYNVTESHYQFDGKGRIRLSSRTEREESSEVFEAKWNFR